LGAEFRLYGCGIQACRKLERHAPSHIAIGDQT
jgi:hypothetical protein